MHTETRHCVVIRDSQTGTDVVRSGGGTKTQATNLSRRFLSRGLISWTKEYEKETGPTFTFTNSIAIGQNASASGFNSIAIGTYACAPLGTAIGRGATSTKKDQLVIGTEMDDEILIGGINIKERFAELAKVKESYDKLLVLQALTYALCGLLLAELGWRSFF